MVRWRATLRHKRMLVSGSILSVLGVQFFQFFGCGGLESVLLDGASTGVPRTSVCYSLFVALPLAMFISEACILRCLEKVSP